MYPQQLHLVHLLWFLDVLQCLLQFPSIGIPKLVRYLHLHGLLVVYLLIFLSLPPPTMDTKVPLKYLPKSCNVLALKPILSELSSPVSAPAPIVCGLSCQVPAPTVLE